MARMQVGGHTQALKTALRWIALLAVLAGVVLMATVEFGFVVMIVIGALVWIPLEIDAAITRGRRAWVEDTQTGFRFTNRRGEFELRDSDVTGIAVEQRLDQSRMNDVRSITKTRLWTGGDPEPLVMESFSSQAQPDPLAPLVNRLIAGLIDRTHAALQQGGTLQGDGWQLTRYYLEVGPQDQAERFELPNVAAIDVFDNRVCVWRKGMDQASARIPLVSRNACLLPALAARLMPQHDGHDERLTGGGLGRVLFERKRPALAMFVCAIIFGAICLISLVVALDDPASLWITAMFGLLTLGSVAVGINHLFSRFRCHERGVHVTGLFGEQTLRYDEVERFTFDATRQYVNGAYAGTTMNLTFEPLPGSLEKRIQYSTTVKGSDDDLDALRDHIGRVIAGRLAQQLSSGQPVIWTNSLTLRPDAIEYRPSGLLGRKDGVLLPYDNYAGFNVDQGIFFLFAKDKTTAVFQERLAAPNFYPGFFLLLSMLHQPEENTAA